MGVEDMIHIRVDDEELNSKREFACGLGPELPEGDVWVEADRPALHLRVDCPGCMPFRIQLGTPLSELSGRPGHPGYEKFCSIARSWGYD